jgi:F0F1-type ATP synthase assembly protein I
MSLAGRIVVVQALLGLAVSAAFFVFDESSGQSALLAVVTSWVPTAYYAWVQSRTLNATRLLMHGVLKTILTITLMAVFMVKVVVEPIGFFVTFTVMQLSYLSGNSQPQSGVRKINGR